MGKSAASSTANIGSLLTQLGKGITPSSFSDSWAGLKPSWLKDAGNVKDAAGSAKSLSK